MRRRHRREGDGGLGAAGWLFAELALVLVVIAFGSEPHPSRSAVPTPSPSPSPSPSSSSSSSPSSPTAPPSGVQQEGLVLESVVFFVAVPPGGAGVLDAFRGELDARVLPNQRVGLVQLFGVPRGGTSGPDVSRELMRAVVGHVPKLPREQQIRPFLGDEGGPGTVKVELFLMTGTG
ncbi:hypothetical protein GCM10010492_57570 [Saccharothrix mutabilis subsp. mutabilis]|uniref:Uncharacterized protein n=1 Tax=Saccharothrix mutabilis subsp. mutabilis TaxID=66855 RepID=A0ABP3E5A1_9PSEU